MPYERFDAWQACHKLTLTTYALTSEFPRHELYGLTSQMRRAAFSAAANIAEGSARDTVDHAGKLTMGLYKAVARKARRHPE